MKGKEKKRKERKERKGKEKGMEKEEKNDMSRERILTKKGEGKERIKKERKG